MLVYNTHQPSSPLHRFKINAKVRFCRHVLRHAIAEHSARRNNVGFVFGGDANCMRLPWSTAFLEEPAHRVLFQEPSFLCANEDIVVNLTKAKDGDIGVVTGMKNLEGGNSIFVLKVVGRHTTLYSSDGRSHGNNP